MLLFLEGRRHKHSPDRTAGKQTKDTLVQISPDSAIICKTAITVKIKLERTINLIHFFNLPEALYVFLALECCGGR